MYARVYIHIFLCKGKGLFKWENWSRTNGKTLVNIVGS